MYTITRIKIGKKVIIPDKLQKIMSGYANAKLCEDKQ